MISIPESQTTLAIDMAGIFANPDWFNQAELAVQRLIHQGTYFTTDDVWELLKESGLTTPEPRALGSVIRQFAKDRQIVATGSYRKSIRPECHRRPLAVWRPVNYKYTTRDAE
jgi:hypothetical protein